MAAFEVKEYSRSLQMAAVVVSKLVMSNFWNYIRKIVDHVMQSTGAYHLHMKGDKSSLGTWLFQDV